MEQAVLIYDGSCPFCGGAKAWVERRAPPGAFEFLPCQDPARPGRFPGITEEACLGAMHLILPGGRVLAGHQAVPEVLRRLPRWRWAAPVFRAPGADRIAGMVYRWIAHHRFTLPSRRVRRET